MTTCNRSPLEAPTERSPSNNNNDPWLTIWLNANPVVADRLDRQGVVLSRGCKHRQRPSSQLSESREQISTDLLQRIQRPSLVIHQGKFNGIKGQALDFIGRTERNEFYVILDLDFAQQAMR